MTQAFLRDALVVANQLGPPLARTGIARPIFARAFTRFAMGTTAVRREF